MRATTVCDLADRHADQRIADRSADHAGFLAVSVQHGKQPRQPRLPQQRNDFRF
jgi:hypothetical protein